MSIRSALGSVHTDQARQPSTKNINPANRSMCCVLKRLPVIDFGSGHLLGGMSERKSASPQRRREDAFPLRAAVSKETPKEDVEMVESLPDQPRALATGQHIQNNQTLGDSPSPAYDIHNAGSKSPSLERMRQSTPGSTSIERSPREPSRSYTPGSSDVPNETDAFNGGQVCR